MDGYRLEIRGIKELNRALKKVDSDLPKGVRVALNGCSDFLIGKVQPQIPKVTGRAARSMRAASTRNEVRIKVGTRVAPYYPWLDFGGQGRVAGRPPERTFAKEGRYLYPTARKSSTEFQRVTENALTGVIRGAGLQEG